MATPDDLYEALVQAHAGLSNEQSDDFNARLIVLLANHVNDLGVLRKLIAQALASGEE